MSFVSFSRLHISDSWVQRLRVFRLSHSSECARDISGSFLQGISSGFWHKCSLEDYLRTAQNREERSRSNKTGPGSKSTCQVCSSEWASVSPKKCKNTLNTFHQMPPESSGRAVNRSGQTLMQLNAVILHLEIPFINILGYSDINLLLIYHINFLKTCHRCCYASIYYLLCYSIYLQ